MRFLTQVKTKDSKVQSLLLTHYIIKHFPKVWIELTNILPEFLVFTGTKNLIPCFLTFWSLFNPYSSFKFHILVC